MPYTREGKNILKHGKVVQHCTSVENAKKALNLRRGIEHGFVPTGKPAQKK